MNADNAEAGTPIRLVMAVDEGTYHGLWYEPPDRRQPLTPRIFPPPAQGKKPKVIPMRTAVHAEPLYIGPVGRDCDIAPRVSTREERFLRPAGSPTLGPNAYLFCGPVSAVDKWGYRDSWHLDAVVDCGVPLNFDDRYMPMNDPSLPVLENWAREGTWLTGIAKLSAWGWRSSGLSQAVAGHVSGMQVLELDPENPAFGKVRRVPFGHRLTVDPDFVQHESVWVVLDVTEIGPPMYRPFPARPAECPEPSIRDLVRIEDGAGPRIVQVTAAGGQEPPPDSGEPVA